MNTSLGAVRVKKYAAGGVVESQPIPRTVSPWSIKGIYNAAKGVLSKSPEQKAKDAEIADKARNQPTPQEATPQEVAPQVAAPKGISAYVANTALQEREAKAMKAAGFKKGGAVRGPGTGTSDDVPIMASNGEFMIKASAVKKIGIKALEALNAIGDKKDGKAGKKDGIPAMKKGGAIRCMASGGLVEEEKRREAYLAAQQKVNDLEPSYFSQATPTSTQNLEQAKQAANAAYQSIYSPAPSAAPSAVPTTATPATPTPQAAPVNARGQGYDDPRLVNKDPSRASLGASRDFSKELNAVPAQLPADLRQGVIHKTMGPGGSTTYSGMNVAPDAQGNTQMVDGMGKTIPMRGSVTMPSQPQQPGGAIRALGSYGGGADGGEALQAARMAAVKRGDIESVRSTYGGDFGGKTKADYATDPILGAIRNLANGPMTAKRAAAMAQLQSGLGATIAGQGQADSSAAQTKLAQQKFGVDAKSAGIDQEVKSNMLAAQKVMADPNATPAQKAAAEENYRAWQGKYAKEVPEQYAFAPGGQSVDPTTGQPVTQPGVIFNKATGEIKQQGGQKSIQTDPRATAIKNNAALSREQKITELKKIGYQ